MAWLVLVIWFSITTVLLFARGYLVSSYKPGYPHANSVRYQTLEEAAATMAASQNLSRYKWVRRRSIHRMRRRLQRNYQKLQVITNQGEALIPAAQWLVDNYYVIDEQAQGIELTQRGIHINHLPVLAMPERHITRIDWMMREFVAIGHGKIDQESLALFLERYQQISPLTLLELAAIVPVLQRTLFEAICELAYQCIQEQYLRMRADAWVDQIMSEQTPMDVFIPNKDIHQMVYLEKVLQRLRDEGVNGNQALTAIDQWLYGRGQDGEAILQAEHQRQASQQIRMGNLVSSLKGFDDADWSETFESVCVVEKILRQDPGCYRQMDKKTRELYRKKVEIMARRAGMEEMTVANLAVECARQHAQDPVYGHVGAYLLGRHSKALAEKLHLRTWLNLSEAAKETLYLFSIALCSVLLLGGMGWLVIRFDHNTPIMLIALLPMAVLSLYMGSFLVNYLITRWTHPQILPKIDYKEGIPPQMYTAVIIPALLSSPKRVQEISRQLEIHHLSCRDREFAFVIVGDYADSKEMHQESDKEIYQAARKQIEALNEKYAGENRGFFLFMRNRQYVEKDKLYMGHERKRGALMAFNQYVLDSIAGDFIDIPQENPFTGLRYIITLDADTRMPIGAAKRMVGAISHPLNHAVWSSEAKRIVQGYGILQPKITIDINSARSSAFSMIFSGNAGLDAYSGAVSDPYQDLFGEGIYTGKGIYDIRAVHHSLEGALPDSTVLSHDLLEGSYARAGFLSDVELVDGFPSKVSSYLNREHRWARGDWQLCPWLFPRIRTLKGIQDNPLHAMARWRIAHNLVRSLTAPAMLLLALAAAWLSNVPALMTMLVMSGLHLLPPVFDLIWLGIRGKADWKGLRIPAARAAISLAMLPGEALMFLDAMLRTLWRILLSHRHMLQWVTSADADGTLHADRNRIMIPGVMMGLAFTVLSVFSCMWFIPLGLIWMMSPFFIKAIQAPVDKQAYLHENETQFLRIQARLIWRYFEEHMTENNHYLPPDNVQLHPRNKVTTRTSPTNIGLAGLSCLSAVDLGFFSPMQMLDLLERMADCIEQLDKWNGHLYNWYDTTRAKPLKPVYISSVDSGNLAASLWCIAYSLSDVVQEKPDVERISQGLLDTLQSICQSAPVAGREAVRGEIMSLRSGQVGLEQALGKICKLIAPSSGLEEVLKLAQGQMESLHADSEELLARAHKLADKFNALVNQMDFSKLYDPKRKLLAIGMDIEQGKMSGSHYDLLASEARLSSLIAIAKGDIPVKHWARMGRSVVKIGRWYTLVSWSGTMFEYLMPLLFIQQSEGTLLQDACRGALEVQRQFAKRYQIPWGVSESGYHAFDMDLNYQYRAFGMPAVSYRNAAAEKVVSPYSSFLALAIEPRESVRNLMDIESQGCNDAHGLYEALDYASSRRGSKPFESVKSYMAHHLGMSLASINNLLNHQILQRRFGGIPAVQSASLLLQERSVRAGISVRRRSVQIQQPKAVTRPALRTARNINGIGAIPQTHLLSGSGYNIMLADTGEGYSRWNHLSIHRWRPDGVLGKHGVFFYIKNVETGQIWSAAFQPLATEPDRYRVRFDADHVVYQREDGEFDTSYQIGVLAEDRGEARTLELHNRGDKPATLEVTVYLEPTLCKQEADQAHPAFGDLFIETRWEREILLAIRRPWKDASPVVLAATLFAQNAVQETQVETDRLRFIGRGRDLSSPVGLHQPLSGTVGFVLTPALCLRKRIVVEPGQTGFIGLMLGVADHVQSALSMAEGYQSRQAFARSMDMVAMRTQVEMRYLSLHADAMNRYLEMSAQLIYPWRTKEHLMALSKIQFGQLLLWESGISGDWPIVVVELSKHGHLTLLKQIIDAHSLWHMRGMRVDLVIINGQQHDYNQPLHERIMEMINSSHARNWMDSPGGIYLRRKNMLSEGCQNAIQAYARWYFKGDRGTLGAQARIQHPSLSLAQADQWPEAKVDYPDGAYEEIVPVFFNQYGGFIPDKNEYMIQVSRDQETPMPWSNIIANEQFGCLITQRGSGYTWVKNSREYKLTPWSNDGVSEPFGEALYLRDERSGQYWSPMPGPVTGTGMYRTFHGWGYTRFEYNGYGFEQRTCVFVHPDKPIKFQTITIKNTGDKAREVSLTAVAQPVLGSDPTQRIGLIGGEEAEASAVWVQNRLLGECELVLYLAMPGERVEIGSDRRLFFGHGCMTSPLAMQQHKLPPSGEDMLLALRGRKTIQPGEHVSWTVVLGQADKPEQIAEQVEPYCNARATLEVLEQARQIWQERLGGLVVETPDTSTNLMLNGWMLYQTWSARILARTGFYQAGGAIGFRDQLQDMLALLYNSPKTVRGHLLESAEHQYIEGDVQHWWHPPRKGVRTHITDDLLFLPFMLAQYIAFTGDERILDESVHYIEGPPAPPGGDWYGQATLSDISESIYLHACRAVELVADRMGERGLPLIGTGDWNDAMNSVGDQGRGESVWLGWFYLTVLGLMQDVCGRKNDSQRQEQYREIADKLIVSLHEHGWDANWWRRAYHDDGRPLGSASSEECRIDCISQSWAVLSGRADAQRAAEGMEAVGHYLLDSEQGLLKLLTPPFNHSDLEPGYIQGYVPGVRENGGQYTHAAAWAILAWAKLGDRRAWDAFYMLNPINHALTRREAFHYKVEPYVYAADVYAAAPHVGRGGWTWYTGSASWMYRAGIEGILGLYIHEGVMTISPCIPAQWDGYRIQWRHDEAQYDIVVENPEHLSACSLQVSLNERLVDNAIPLARYGCYKIRVLMSRPPEPTDTVS